MSKIKLRSTKAAQVTCATFKITDGKIEFLGFYFPKRSNKGKYSFKAKRQSVFKIKQKDRYRISDIYLGNVVPTKDTTPGAVVQEYVININKTFFPSTETTPYKVVCDESNNPSESVKKGILTLDIHFDYPQYETQVNSAEPKKENNADSTV